MLYTSGEIAKSCGTTREKIQYIVRRLGIQPERHVGCIRLFDDAALAAIRAKVQQTKTLQRTN